MDRKIINNVTGNEYEALGELQYVPYLMQ
ncbi:hypothetical protein A1C_00430 [Rickettsia akari str. Hartford]|uniref:Uncharacterized protein n=1 Tax=Rickettsia akari (strain Hartford) TaxID=293614 RepID=A8GLZ4_RICAH|nr:hypothetical protein A1C_00430 [Rickettsia akari str. Hartford]